MKYNAFPNKVKSLILLTLILAGYALLFLINSFLSGENQTMCIFKNITGTPCPGCGMGRSTLELMQGNFMASFWYHPFGIFFHAGILTSIVFLIKDIRRDEVYVLDVLKQKPTVLAMVLLTVLIVAVWSWNIYRGI